MRTRPLGATGLNVTAVGLGTWAIGGSGWQFSWGPQDDAGSIRAIRRALELGINWIDTAAVYGRGHSEEIVGKALHGLGNRPLVGTKCGRVWDEKGLVSGRLTRESLRAETEASLRRLRIDAIDLYQIHWPNPQEMLEDAWTTLAQLVQEGKVRFIGVCNSNVEQLKRIHPIHPVASLQPPYSMLVRGIETETLEYCAKSGIGVVVYSPMQKGLLTGAFTPQRAAALPEDDHRRRDPNFQEPRLSTIIALVDRLRPIAEKHGRTVAQLAIAWTLRRSEVTAAIVGARAPSQIEETAPAADWTLPAEDIVAIDRLLASSGL